MRVLMSFGLLLGVMATGGVSGDVPVGEPIGVFEGSTDIGLTGLPGAVSYDDETETYLVNGSGSNMWSDHDDFYLVWRRLRGDFILRARAEFEGEGNHPHRKLGWIVRSELEPSSPHIALAVHGDGLTSLQFRRTAGSETEEVRSPVIRPEVIQLARDGDAYRMSVARFGETLSRGEPLELDLGAEVYVGIFVCSHDEDVSERAIFRNVRIVSPAPDDLVPYRDYLGSNLEILEVESGYRQIIHSVSDSLQAPNWTPDGESLIYNRNGLLYRLDLEEGRPQVLDTGFATNNNNDHVLSFDGRMLGISHHDSTQEDRSMVYVVPAEGGTPRQVTSIGPSYLHGWSPDGKHLIYTAEREGAWNIYRIGVDGGDEERLTDSAGLDDGSEYSPDGRFIYFNSVRSGTMEIWRMRPDGSALEQLTDDRFNNWFPHLSPDGHSVVFLSFLEDVDPADHPFYKEVYLRTISAAGGEPRVIAYLYGGQGTINVPSWAPDGRRLAFVSNSGDLD